MSKYVKLEDIQSFPIRSNHYDHVNGNSRFIFGIESVMEYIELLPKYEFPDTKPIITSTDQEDENDR